MFGAFCVLLSCAVLASGALTNLEKRPMPDGRIVGGFRIDITQAPWQASLQLNGEHKCGASIISDRWLLTAAHCLMFPGRLSVRVGSTENARGGFVYGVKNAIRHENFEPATIDWDYALLELEQNIRFSAAAKPIKLIGFQQSVPDQTLGLVTGWGTTQSSESNRILHGAEVPILNQQVCANAYRRTGSITPRMMCAGLEQGGKDSCQGDSGGPLAVYDIFNSPVLVGVVSWGYGCARPNFPGVYSRITVARDWIYRHSGI